MLPLPQTAPLLPSIVATAARISTNTAFAVTAATATDNAAASPAATVVDIVADTDDDATAATDDAAADDVTASATELTERPESISSRTSERDQPRRWHTACICKASRLATWLVAIRTTSVANSYKQATQQVMIQCFYASITLAIH